MTHIRRVGIRGYRSIYKADLRLGRITVVLGPSDTGKSNLIRALRDWAYGATGSKFMTVGAVVTRVACAVQGRWKIVWEKGGERGKLKARSRYVVEDAEGERVSYEKFGQTIPREITDITGIRPVVVDDLKVNAHFAHQDEAAFLLARPPWTGTAVAKIIGRISGIDSLVLANRDLASERSTCRKKITELKVLVDEEEGKLAKFHALDELDRIAGEAEVVEARLAASRAKLDEAHRGLARFREAKEELAAARRRRGVLKVALSHVGTTDLLERANSLAKAERLMARLQRLEGGNLDATQRRDLALGRLEGCAAMLREIAEDEDLTCPTCDGPAHEECRARLVEAAERVED